MIKKKVYLLNTPEHGNLGDHAIAMAEKKFLNDYFPEFEVREIIGTDSSFQEKLQLINDEDIIFLSGGGYLGDLWPWEDERCKKIIQQFPKNKIIYFPQTYFFAEKTTCKTKIAEDRAFYEQYPNVSFFLRDAASYQLVAKEICSNINHVRKYPDIALYGRYEKQFDREGILLCLRSDKERISKREWEEDIVAYAKQNNMTINYTDMVEGDYLKVNDRENVVNRKMDEFASAQLVITDRLHGMIFAALTGTPCIAFDNVSKKVSGVYQWIKKLEYIVCVTEENFNIECLKIIEKYNEYDSEILESYFCDMAYYIRIKESESIKLKKLEIT